MHHYYQLNNITDGQKMHDDAQTRLTDKRSPEESIVHAHKHGLKCNGECKAYLFAKTLVEEKGKQL